MSYSYCSCRFCPIRTIFSHRLIFTSVAPASVSAAFLRILHILLWGLAAHFQSFSSHSRLQYRAIPHPPHLSLPMLEQSFQSHLACISSLADGIIADMLSILQHWRQAGQLEELQICFWTSFTRTCKQQLRQEESVKNERSNENLKKLEGSSCHSPSPLRIRIKNIL